MKITSRNIDFIGKKNIFLLVSAVLFSLSLFFILSKGFQYGVDFRGGTIVQIQFQEKVELQPIRDLFDKQLKTSIQITTFGRDESNEILLSLPQGFLGGEGNKEEITERIPTILSEQYSNFEIRRVESIGPKVGEQLKQKASYAVLYALFGILLYIWLRFKFSYALGALVALFHDVILTLGIFSMTEREISLTVVAAILTIVGYSLNDTIVVFDRIRENRIRSSKKKWIEIINSSINQSLSRTLLTSLTTFFVVTALFILGGDIIHDFSFALMVGVAIGTYSSIFVASPTLLHFQKTNS